MLLWQFYWELFDLFEQGLVVLDMETMDKEDDSACASHGDEHPCVDGKTEDRCLRYGRAWVDQRGLDRKLEWADGTGVNWG